MEDVLSITSESGHINSNTMRLIVLQRKKLKFQNWGCGGHEKTGISHITEEGVAYIFKKWSYKLCF
jgi:hypothetical protein